MECRHLLAPAAAGLLLAASVRLRAEEPAPPPLQVNGGDFPALVMMLPSDLADVGRHAAPGCGHVRARRIDELAPNWRLRATSVQLECEETLADNENEPQVALVSRAVLQPGSVQLADRPVTEVRLMDSASWGDHQYVLAVPYEDAHLPLRQHVEAACRQRRLQQEAAIATACTMVAAGDGLFLPADEVGGIWIHRDPDDAARTIYAETWAD